MSEIALLSSRAVIVGVVHVLPLWSIFGLSPLHTIRTINIRTIHIIRTICTIRTLHTKSPPPQTSDEENGDGKVKFEEVSPLLMITPCSHRLIADW